jgi:hypothetical protein
VGSNPTLSAIPLGSYLKFFPKEVPESRENHATRFFHGALILIPVALWRSGASKNLHDMHAPCLP